MDIMEKLLASQTSKLVSVSRGQQVQGAVVAKGDKDITLDIGAKSEGILQARDIPQNQLENLKIGDKLEVYVSQVENESGQIALTLNPSLLKVRSVSLKGSKLNWSKFIQAQTQNTKLKGKVLEINKGGLIVEVEGVRGFLPNSQVGFELMNQASKGMEGLVGQEITLSVIEIDQSNNRLIFSQRGQVSEDIRILLKHFKVNQKITGKILAILPFGLILSVKDQSGENVEGIVFSSDVAWEKIEDLSPKFSVNQEIETQVLGIDEELGRLNLSIKHLAEDPFDELIKEYKEDEVVKGEVTSVSNSGISIQLTDPSGELGISGVEGFIPSSKIDAGTKYEVGQNITALVDGVDKIRRRINLAPFITSTAGLIYK